MSEINTQMLKEIMPGFNKFLASEGQQWIEERKEKDEFFSKYFSEEEIENLDEGTLRELIHILWAFNFWTNKDWVLQEMLKSGLPTIKSAFRKLLYGEESIGERFDRVKKDVIRMGAACVSEVLTHHDHDKYPIWNRRSRRGLITLGISEDQLPKSTQTTGSQYSSFCKLMQEIRTDIAKTYPEISDLFNLDFLLYFVSAKKVESEERITTQDEDFDHDSAIDQLLELGDGLGFEVEKEFTVTRGCRIDAIWRSRIANLGTIAYAFEVHRRGSRDSAILNLQRVRRDPTIQKVIIVSSGTELENFKQEIATLDEHFRESVGYFEVQNLQRALDHLEGLKDILKTLGLLNMESLLD